MSNVKAELKEGVMTVSVSGNVDSSNAPDIEKEIRDSLEGQQFNELILDAEDLNYISSAGLRIILRLKKDYSEFKVTNVRSEVYEILEMTGFTEMMTIEKAYRKFSVDGCEVIGQGANGTVYRYDADTIVKVYNKYSSLDDIKREREMARKALILGIPTAIPYDVVKVGENFGSVFELLNADSFAKLLINGRYTMDEIVDMDVELIKKIHATEVKEGDMPSMKAVAVDWVDFLKDHLPLDEWKKLNKMMNDIPETHHMLHGDYHLKNVMMQNGEVLLIDMDTLCEGHPIFELAAVFNAYIGFNSADHSVAKSFLGLEWDDSVLFFNKFMHKYLEGRSEEEIQEIIKKASIVGFTRILRRTIKRSGYEDGKPLIDKARECLDKNIPEVDSLYF